MGRFKITQLGLARITGYALVLVILGMYCHYLWKYGHEDDACVILLCIITISLLSATDAGVRGECKWECKNEEEDERNLYQDDDDAAFRP